MRKVSIKICFSRTYRTYAVTRNYKNYFFTVFAKHRFLHFQLLQGGRSRKEEAWRREQGGGGRREEGDPIRFPTIDVPP